MALVNHKFTGQLAKAVHLLTTAYLFIGCEMITIIDGIARAAYKTPFLIVHSSLRCVNVDLHKITTDIKSGTANSRWIKLSFRFRRPLR